MNQMGKASETMMVTQQTTTPKKKKGRPSLLDLQNRRLQQQQQIQQSSISNNNPNPHFPIQNPNNHHNHNQQLPPRRIRSSRRNPNLPSDFLDFSDFDDEFDDDDDDDERLQKKVRRLPPPSDSSIPNSSSFHSFNSDNAAPQDEKGTKATDTDHGTSMVANDPTTATATASTSTPLPDKKLLLLILDRLQKKDTRGVFAEPVDPEELPDYHEVIENPMDFGTVRNKLCGGQYSNLEQLEADINLICSNAMEYNAPSTIFFRQARSIQELAKKEFETVRQDAGQPEAPPKPRRGRPPGSRNLKKLLESSSLDRGVRESSSEATPAPRDDDATRSSSYNLRKGPSLYRFPRSLESCLDFSGSASKSTSVKYGNKQYDSEDSRRETYNLSGHQFDSGQDTSFLTMFGDFEKQLIPVGLDCNRSYARSLAQFAADLGPVVWKIVSKKIKSVLPPGVEFDPGWVCENKVPSAPLPALPEKADCVLQDTFKSESHYPSTSGFASPPFASKPPACSNENLVEATGLISSSEWSSMKCINGVTAPGSSFQMQRSPVLHPGMNGFSGGFGSGFQFQEGMAMTRPAASSFNPFQTPKSECSPLEASRGLSMSRMQLSPIDFHAAMNAENELGAYGMPYWQSVSTQERWDRSCMAEPNVGYQEASSSRSTNLPIGSPPQLDLVLQL